MVRDIKEQGKNGVMELSEENFKNEAVTENVRYSSEVQKELSNLFGNIMRKAVTCLFYI